MRHPEGRFVGSSAVGGEGHEAAVQARLGSVSPQAIVEVPIPPGLPSAAKRSAL